MNCECIYYGKDATEDELMVLADKINALECELEPVTIAIVENKTKVTPDYDGWKRPFNVPEKSLVLFVCGKYHYMNNFRVGDKTFKSCFPMDYDFEFTDIKEF